MPRDAAPATFNPLAVSRRSGNVQSPCREPPLRLLSILLQRAAAPVAFNPIAEGRKYGPGIFLAEMRTGRIMKTMKASRDRIVSFCNAYLEADRFKDSAPPGLQFEGSAEVKKIATGVSVSLEFLEKAAAAGASLALVHHGMFWDNDSPVITGSRRKRIEILVRHNMSLAAFHLPLDAHPKAGNNIQIIKRLGLKRPKSFAKYAGSPIGFYGEYRRPLDFEHFLNRVEEIFNTKSCIVFPHGKKRIASVGAVSGGAAFNFKDAIRLGLDVYITGEAGEPVQAWARENNIHFIAVGHHNSEKFGVQKLGELLAKKFKIPAEFIDVPNPA